MVSLGWMNQDLWDIKQCSCSQTIPLEFFANKNLSRLLYFVILVQDVNQDKWYVMS